MGQQDKSEKLLEEHNDVFADIINVCIYGGRMIILETELQPSTARSQYKADDSKLHENERDISKYWNKGGVTFALYAIENQTDTDKRMPLRIIAYDGANYRSQLLNKHVDEVLKMLSVFGGMTEFEKAYQSISQKERRGDLTMCEFIQRTIRDDVQKGIAEGLAKCMAEEFPKRLDEEVSKRLAEELPKRLDEEVSKRLAEELSKKHSDILLSCIQNLQKNLNCTLSDALAYLGKTFEEYTQAMQLLNPS